MTHLGTINLRGVALDGYLEAFHFTKSIGLILVEKSHANQMRGTSIQLKVKEAHALADFINESFPR